MISIVFGVVVCADLNQQRCRGVKTSHPIREGKAAEIVAQQEPSRRKHRNPAAGGNSKREAWK